jgi:hypothetical protein
MKHCLFLFILFLFILSSNSIAQQETNYDENKVPKYKLPELLVTKKGERIHDAKSWIEKRRPELLSLFEENIYGKIPGVLPGSFKLIEQGNDGLNGKAIRKQVVLTYKGNGKEINLNLLIFLPKTKEKVPLVIGLNFWGNQTLAEDTAIIISKGTRRARGIGKIMLPAERLIEAGYGLATIYMGDMDPDKQGEPDYPNKEQYEAIKSRDCLEAFEPERMVQLNDGKLKLSFKLPAHAISFIEISLV